jgi:hypothetical protein
MPIGRYYTIEFKNVEDILVKVLIGDKTIDAETPEIIPLQPSGSPLILSTFDNDEAKFTPIKGQKAQITFLSNEQYSLETFSDGADDRFDVTILYGTTIVFYGFLSLADNSELFVSGRNEVVLTANDKLGALKDIPLTDFDGVNPIGKYKIGELIAMCLQKTGLSLPLRVINNLRHGTGAITVSLTDTTFTAGTNMITLGATYNGFFYNGQRLLVSGTVSNNIEFTVSGVGLLLVTFLVSSEDLVNETASNVTFTDVTGLDHIYHGIYLDAKTFEDEIGVSENCYDVLKKILGYDCFLTQYKECWWICRIDEYDSNPFYVSRFDENGVYVDSYVETNLSKTIGRDQEHWFEGEATIVQPTRPVGFAKLTYTFDYPEEIVCNQDFSRGTGDEPTDTIPSETIIYDPECWEFYANHFDGSAWTDGTPQAGARGELVKLFEYGYEKDRYMLIEHEDVSGGDEVHYFKSAAIDMRRGDKINLSVDFKIEGVSGLTSLNPMQVTLIPHDGSDPWYWELDTASNVNQWVQRATPTTNPFSTTIRWQGTNSDEFQNVGGESLPLPTSGFLYVQLSTNFNIFAPYIFTNLQFTYIPFINGSYRVYNGRHEKVTRTEPGYLGNVDDDVFISDAEVKLFKGAMFFLADGIYQLTVKWYNAALFALGYPTDLSMVKPFGNHQAYAVWNQYRLANRIFQYQFQDFGADIPSLVHKFSISDFSSHSNDRYFLMLTKEADLMLCNMTGTLEQVYHTTEGKDYDSDHEFKYIS